MDTQQSKSVSPDQVKDTLDEMFLEDHPNRFERIKQILMDIIRHGIDWRNGNPFKQIGKHIESKAKEYEAAEEARKRHEKLAKRTAKWGSSHTWGIYFGGCSAKKTKAKRRREIKID